MVPTSLKASQRMSQGWVAGRGRLWHCKEMERDLSVEGAGEGSLSMEGARLSLPSVCYSLFSPHEYGI